MTKSKVYNIFTDASFNSKTKLATYSIVVKKGNKILKSFSKKSRIKIKNSTEIEVFAVYQAINLIMSCYINKNERQNFYINTDCKEVVSFFESKKAKIFKNNLEIKNDMINVYNAACKKLSRKNSEFKIQWISRNLNTIAHNQAYSMFKRVSKILEVSNSKEDLLINKNTFCEILSNFNKNQNLIIIHLFSISNQEGLILTTQKQVSEALNISITIINKTFNRLKEMNILEKVKNGRYMLLT